jgi:hypothetical protein
LGLALAGIVSLTMDVAELIEIALANADDDRVDVVALDPVEIAVEAVGALVQVIAELVDNALAFSDPGDSVRITGLNDRGTYLISISDHGVGIPLEMISALNQVLDDPVKGSGPDPNLGISLVARLASRHHIGVRLVPGVPGTSARITVPARFVDPPIVTVPEPEHEASEGDRRLPARSGDQGQTLDLTTLEMVPARRNGVSAMSEETRRQAEVFLERVFASLLASPEEVHHRPVTPPLSNGNGKPQGPTPAPPPDRQPGTGATVTTLRVRIPGENFTDTEDEPSTMSGEGAIDIRSALDRFADGRRSAQENRPADN